MSIWMAAVTAAVAFSQPASSPAEPTVRDTVIRGTVFDLKTAGPLKGALVEMYDEYHTLIAATRSSETGEYRLKTDRSLLGRERLVMARHDPSGPWTSSAQSKWVEITDTIVYADLYLKTGYDWQSDEIATVGGSFGPYGDQRVRFIVPPNTFNEPVYLRYRSLPPAAWSVAGLPEPSGAFLSEGFTIEMVDRRGEIYAGPWHGPVTLEMAPSAFWLEQGYDYAKLFGAGAEFPSSPTHLSHLDETGPARGTMVPDNTYEVDPVANLIRMSFDHATTFATAMSNSEYEKLGIVISKNGVSCSSIIPGDIICGQYAGLSESYKMSQGSTTGSVREALDSLTMKAGATISGIFSAELARKTGTTVSQSGEVTTITDRIKSIANGDKLGGPCESGWFDTFLVHEHYLVAFADASDELSIPTRFEMCGQLWFDLLCGAHCDQRLDVGDRPIRQLGGRLPCCQKEQGDTVKNGGGNGNGGDSDG